MEKQQLSMLVSSLVFAKGDWIFMFLWEGSNEYIYKSGNKPKRAPLSEHPSPFMALAKHIPTVITVVCAFCQGDNCGNWVASCQAQILLWRKSEPSCIPSYSDRDGTRKSLMKQRNMMGLLLLLLFFKRKVVKKIRWLTRVSRMELGCQRHQWLGKACCPSLALWACEREVCWLRPWAGPAGRTVAGGTT